MAKNTLITKTSRIRDQEIARQFDNIVNALNQFPFIGMFSTDPTTTGWGEGDVCWWVNTSTATAITIKFWNGAAVRTITSA